MDGPFLDMGVVTSPCADFCFVGAAGFGAALAIPRAAAERMTGPLDAFCPSDFWHMSSIFLLISICKDCISLSH